jgi:DtxR family Mn-dependent transcriptional regulator
MEAKKMQSENAEMYLVSMAILEETGTPTPIPIPRLAEEMDVQTVSANQMVRKLEEEGLVTYQPYKGVSFTKAGKEAVDLILRNRRLWEVFFVSHLNFTPSEADALACRMEHITQPEVAARLSEMLGHPENSPTGRRIPALGEESHLTKGIPLTEVQPGAKVEVLTLNLDEAASAYLRSENLVPGTIVAISAISGSGAILLEVDQKRLSIGSEIAAGIIVSHTKEPKQYAA